MSQGDLSTIVEVGPRDGFQAIGPFIPTSDKLAIIEALYAAGARRMEVTSFVSPNALPQLSDAVDILQRAAALPGLDAQVLVPTARHAERALAAGASHLSAVLSVSERHNMANVRRMPRESAEDYAQIVAMLPERGRMRLNLATAFDCPFSGRIADDDLLELLEFLVSVSPDVEIAMCDTTGRAGPREVQQRFDLVRRRFPEVRAWAFHGHDTYGLGAANVYAAWESGVRTFDASIAGLGGCPFAPGATGNVATEDLVWMFERLGVDTGFDLDSLVAASRRAAELPGAQLGGRVRLALGARTEALS